MWALTLYAPIVSKINFLLTISIDCQEQSLRDLWSFIKFSQLILQGIVWRSVWRICKWISGLKGLREYCYELSNCETHGRSWLVTSLSHNLKAPFQVGITVSGMKVPVNSLRQCDNTWPISISYTRTPKDHQSAAESYFHPFKIWNIYKVRKWILTEQCLYALTAVVLPAQAEHSYFSTDIRLKILLYYNP